MDLSGGGIPPPPATTTPPPPLDPALTSGHPNLISNHSSRPLTDLRSSKHHLQPLILVTNYVTPVQAHHDHISAMRCKPSEAA